MFTIIKSWSRANAAGMITANVEYQLRSTKTGETLYQREGKITITISKSTGIGGLWGFVADKVATAVATASTDKIEAGRYCTSYVLANLPCGKYSTSYDKDQELEAGDAIVTATVSQ